MCLASGSSWRISAWKTAGVHASARVILICEGSDLCAGSFRGGGFLGVASRCSWRRPWRLLTLVTLVTLAGCGETTSLSGKITYAFRVQELSIPTPDAQKYVHQTITVSCLSGEFALAGSYNLGSPPIMNDWAAEHPAPGEAQPDANGLYRPVPKLLRVTASRSHRHDGGRPVGWESVIE